MKGEAEINFVRKGLYADALRDYTLFINGEDVGKISKASMLKVPVSAGTHIIEAKIDWCAARPLQVTLRDGETCTIKVDNTYGAWLVLYGATFGRHKYLNLSRVD